MTTYLIIYDDGDTTVTDMASHVTLDTAREYFIDNTFVYHEDEETGKESKHTVIDVRSYKEA